MIPITEYAGRDVAIFGLARSGLSAARALAAGGAIVHAWDDNEAARENAEKEGLVLSDINARDWRGFAALVLSPGVPLTHPKPHRVVEFLIALRAFFHNCSECAIHRVIPWPRRHFRAAEWTS